MAGPPQTRYAKTTDGLHIAYRVLGTGPPDLLLMPGEFVPIDAMHEEPRYAACLDRLASFSRVICFDRRGIGLSDPVSPSAPTTVEQWVVDALAVLDAAGSQTAAVFSPTDGGLAALLLCASHPVRTSQLLLVNAYARTLWAPDFPWGQQPESRMEVADAVTDATTTEPTIDLLGLVAPSVCDDSRFRDWWDRAGHRGASPAVARAMWQALTDTDVRHTLGAIHVPTLVMHRADNRWSTIEHGRYIAGHIEGAKFVALPGADDLWWVGDTEALLGELQEFLTGRRPTPVFDRVLTTVLFTDMVGSTERAAATGDRQWRDLLARHDATVRHELERCRGREVKTMGDGFLATFDGPARAIRCACAIRGALRSLGIEVRAGLHTGEVEVLDADVGGIAVHIGARVMAHAQPGEVLVSATVPPLVAGSGIEFVDRGDHELKGVPGTWRLFAVDG